MAIAKLKENGKKFKDFNGIEIKKKSYFDDKDNELVGTTRIIGMIFPFPEVISISDVTLPWGEKLLRWHKFQNKDNEKSIFDTYSTDSITEAEKAIKRANQIKSFFEKSLHEINQDGNYAGEYVNACLEGREVDSIDEYGNSLTITQRGKEYGETLLNETKKLGNFEVVGTEQPLYIEGLAVVGKYDCLLRDKDTNGLILIDFKTGSKVSGDKKKKVELQLGFYADLVEKEYGSYPEKILVISAYQFEDSDGNFLVKGETISLNTSFVKNFTKENFYHNAETYIKNKQNKLIK